MTVPRRPHRRGACHAALTLRHEGAVSREATLQAMRSPTVAITSPGRLARAGTAAWALLGIVALILLAGWAVGRLMPVVLPFAVAVLLATLLRPIAARLERARRAARRSPRSSPC